MDVFDDVGHGYFIKLHSLRRETVDGEGPFDDSVCTYPIDL